MKRLVCIFAILLISCVPAYACGGGAVTGGATEFTQQLNNTLLGAIKASGLDEVYNTTQMVAKQAQQYATQLQELQQAIMGNLSIPFQIVNDFKNSFSSMYSTVKGTGQGLYSYANADAWMNSMKGRSGFMSQMQYMEQSATATAQAQQDIITKEESEFATADKIQTASNQASGTTGAVQANTQAALLNNATLKDQNLLLYQHFQYIRNRDEQSRIAKVQDREAFIKQLEQTSKHEW